jgi:competence protein ComEC
MRAGLLMPPASRPLVPLAAAFALGIASQHALALRPVAWLLAVACLLFLGVVAWWVGARHLVPPILILAFACLGGQAMAADLFARPAHHLSQVPEAYLASPVLVEAWVVGPPDPRPAETRDTGDPERTRFVVEVTRLRLGETFVAASGRARLTVLGEPPSVGYGDEVRGAFRLRRPRRFDNPGAFDYPAYLATQGIFLEGWTRDPVEVVPAAQGSAVLGAIFQMRRLLLQRLGAAMPAPEAGLLKAMVLGDRSGLSREMNQAFLDSGTYHILAISGLNVSLLAGTLFGLLRLLRVSPRIAAVAAALLVTLYAGLAGGGASVVRAAVMANAYLLAVVLDRRGDLLNSLALSALALLWWNPRFLLDVGFQLTYLATLGIILILARGETRLAPLPWWLRWPLASAVITVAATAMTLPVLASAFNRVALVGILANLPIVPLSGLITALGTAASALLLVTPTGFPWLHQVNGWLVDLLFATARWFAAWPVSTVRIYTPTAGMLVTYYAMGAAWLLGTTPASANGPPLARRVHTALPWVKDSFGEPGLVQTGVAGAHHRRWARWLAVACGLLLVGQVLLRLHLPEGTPRVRMTLLDVGQGEAIFLELPGRRRMLVDAGGVPGDRFDIGARVVTPFLLHAWIGHLDVLALTHAQADHIGGAPSILRSFSVGEVWSGDVPVQSVTFLWIQEYLRHRRIPHRIVSAGFPVVQWHEAAIEVLHPRSRPARAPLRGVGRPSRPNDASLVLKVSLGDRAALLTGDIERGGEAALLRARQPIRAQVLKVPHHGSRTSSALPFLDAVKPEVALVSVGYRNRFHHPHPEVVARYRALGARLLRTDLNGAISVELTPGGIRAWGRRGNAGVGGWGSGVGDQGPPESWFSPTPGP